MKHIRPIRATFWLSVVFLCVVAFSATSQRSEVSKSVGDPSMLTGALCAPMPFERLKVGMSYSEVTKLAGMPSYYVDSPVNTISDVEYHVRTGGVVRLMFRGSLVRSARLKAISGSYVNSHGAVVKIEKSDMAIGAGIATGKRCPPRPFKCLKRGMDWVDALEAVGGPTVVEITPLGGENMNTVDVRMWKYVVQGGGIACLWVWDDDLAQVDACYVREDGDIVEFSWSEWSKSTVEKRHICRQEGTRSLKLGMRFKDVSRILGPPARDARVGLAVQVFHIESRGQILLKFDLQRKVLEGLSGWYVDTSGKEIVYFGPELLDLGSLRHRECPEMVFRKLRIGMSMEEVAKVTGPAKHERKFRARFADYKVGTGGRLRLSFVGPGKLIAVQGWFVDDSGKKIVLGL